MSNSAPVLSAIASPLDPIGFETQLGPLPSSGKWPSELRGTLVRNGPNPYIAVPDGHWFLGDGMLHEFSIESGMVHYRNRWIRTQRLVAQQASGQPHSKSLAVSAGDDGTGNTNVIGHAGHMLALEEAHLPIDIDAGSLDTLGPIDFDGALTGAFTAHPKTDPETGELIFFGFGTPEQLTAGMSYGVMSAQGKVTRFEKFEAPYASMVHDFMVTKDYVMFPVMPLTASQERAMKGLPPYAWEPEFGTRVGIMPRAGGTRDIEWWEGPPSYVFHPMNAWQDPEHPNLLHADVMEFDVPPLFPMPDGSPSPDPNPVAHLVRWTFDTADTHRRFTRIRIDPVPGEFPRIDERFSGLPYRHGWYASHIVASDGHLQSYNGLRHVDHATEERSDFTFNPDDRVSEPVFVPRAADAQEGDGWLLAVVWRAAEDRSDLVVFNALDLAHGPVCSAALPHRVPAGFHGNWFPADAQKNVARTDG
jgi:carotenoid cleavage dioxygenase